MYATALKLVHRHRRVGKRVVSFSCRVLPSALARRLRALAEQIAFRVRPEYQVDTLPPIFHFWAARHISPRALRSGIGSPEQFYFDEICALAESGSHRSLRVISVGSGACAMEVALAARLRERGVVAHFLCVDFNAELMRLGARQAELGGVSALMRFAAHDCNRLPPLPTSEVIIVNQFFHHVEDLESFCSALGSCLAPGGKLLTSDIVGRNGHLLWPDIHAATLRHWAGLPAQKRMDRYFGSVQRAYKPVDHSEYSNEGIRAQDVVRCLLSEFDFELFFTFGGCMMPFVERRLGFNFDPDDMEDQAFIDRVQADDDAALSARRYPASNMIAVLRQKGRAQRCAYDPISPEEHVRLTQLQQAKCESRQRGSGRVTARATTR